MLGGAFVAAERHSPTSVRSRFLFCFSGHSSYRHESTSSHPSLRNSGAFTPIRVVHPTESSERYNLGIVSGVRQKVCFVHMRVLTADISSIQEALYVVARYQELG